MSEKSKKIEVHYILEFENPQDFQRALKIAEDAGYEYNDAGKIETLRRFLMDCGIGEGLPESDFLHTYKVERKV